MAGCTFSKMDSRFLINEDAAHKLFTITNDPATIKISADEEPAGSDPLGHVFKKMFHLFMPN